MSLVPEAVLMSMCAPLVEPCCASYMEVFTRTSCEGLGRGSGQRLADGEIRRRTALNDFGGGAGWRPPKPVLFTMRPEGTELVLLPLNKIAGIDAVQKKVLLVSRWPLAQMGALPRPALAPVPRRKFGVHARREDGDAGEAAGGKRDRIRVAAFQARSRWSCRRR